MISYNEIIEEFPKDFQLPMLKIVDRLREEALDTVRKSDFQELKMVVSSLGTSMEGLAEAQKRTEQRVGELAEAQRKTEETVREMAKKQGKMSKELGGLTNSFGYVLENEAIRFLPGILKRDEGIDIQIMDRRYIVYDDGHDDELNIYGEGVLEGKKVYVVGESKAQLGRKDVDRFNKLLKRVSEHLREKLYPVIVTHSAHPEVESYAKDKIKDLEIYKSYELK